MKVFTMLCFYILLLSLPLEVIPITENEEVKDGSENQNALMKTYNDVVNKGYALKEQYAPIVQSVGSWMYSNAQNKVGTWISNTKVVKSIPIVKFAMEHISPAVVNGKGGIEVDGKQVNLADTLENPALIKPLFSQENTSFVALKSLELVAGQRVSGIVDDIMKEVAEKSIDKNKDGIKGINGNNLFNVLKTSPSVKLLFPQKGTADLIQQAIKFFDTYLCVDDSKTKGKVENGISNGVQKSSSNGSSLMKSFNTLTSTVSNAAATSAKMALSGGKYVMDNKMISAITCFLPVSYPKNALKFICIATYLVVLAHQENVMPKIDAETVGKLNDLTGLEISVLVDKLNNPDLMKKVFPLNDDSNTAVYILKFLAGNEIIVLDKVIQKLKKFREDHPDNQKELTISDLLKDPQFFKELLGMEEINKFTSKIYNEQLLNVASKSVNVFKVTRSPTIPNLIKDSTISDSLMKMPEIEKLNGVVMGDKKRVGDTNEKSENTINYQDGVVTGDERRVYDTNEKSENTINYQDKVVTGDEIPVDVCSEESDDELQKQMGLFAAAYAAVNVANSEGLTDNEKASKLPLSAK